eukprot:CAMPEP_0198221668 /NCGR_PEP_ID=MMETSP1445-20131203/84678_1 /TAXON_ID=36898 /ORGANISM="Pyramimonas sp., Strain CCMP2087" /LENGTH=86 /DNA_ID=CAMNT_0043899893 /DNA_START=83 /DNA_END=343 /DNA_ORIENTATION=+
MEDHEGLEEELTSQLESHGSTLRDIDAALELEANVELEELKAELIAAVDAAKQGLLQILQARLLEGIEASCHVEVIEASCNDSEDS